MISAIVAASEFDTTWPYAVKCAQERWSRQGPVTVVRPSRDAADHQIELHPDTQRLLLLGVGLQQIPLDRLPRLTEIGVGRLPKESSEMLDALRSRQVQVYQQPNEGFWGQSVAEFALALTLCGLRRIPQTYHAMLSSHAPWDYRPVDPPMVRGSQFGDDARFTNGTIAGKRVRIVGVGNIGSRYASFCSMLGADVAAWDPIAPDPAFHRSGARRVTRLEELARDADIFAPMLPLRAETRGIIPAAIIDAIPRGALLVITTRMEICDAPAIRRRVLAAEIALAADVFDVEPLPLTDPLLGRHNVVHTPHNAGRTYDANRAYIGQILDQFTAPPPAKKQSQS